MNFLVGGVLIVLFGRVHRPLGRPDRAPLPADSSRRPWPPRSRWAWRRCCSSSWSIPRQVYSAAIVSGWFWLMIVPAVILAYYSFYAAAFSTGKQNPRPGRTLLLALIGLVNVSLVYSSVFSMAERPDLIRQLYAHHQGGWIFNPDIGDYLWRWAHMILGAIAVGGFCVGALGHENPAAYALGKKSLLWGFILASVAGLAYLLSLGNYHALFHAHAGSLVALCGDLAGFGCDAPLFTGKFWISGAMLFLSLGSMVINRHYVLSGCSGWKGSLTRDPGESRYNGRRSCSSWFALSFASV